MRIKVMLCRMILAVLALCLLTAGAAAADTNDFTFTRNAGGNGYVVSGYNGSETAVTVPDWYDNLPVTEIGAAAFQGNTAVKSVRLPSTIVKIGKAAFKGCKNLEQVTNYTAASQPPAVSVLPGDADRNGTVNANDALLVMQYDAGWNVACADHADVNKDGAVDAKDAVRILQYCAGEISSLE